MKNTFPLIALFLTCCTLPYCTSVRLSADEMRAEPVSWEDDLYPILERSCKPCHFPGPQGKQSMLHTYENTEDKIHKILRRVQKDPSRRAYMPFKEKKPGLTEEEILLFKQWAVEKLPM